MDYNIQTAAPAISMGLDRAMGAYTDMKQRESLAAKRQDGADLLQDGSPEDVAQWSMKNPELAKEFIQAANIEDHLTSRPMVQMAKEALSGAADPVDLINDRIADLEAKGGSTGYLKELRGSDPSDIKKFMVDMLSLHDPKATESYLKSQPQAKKDQSFTLSEGQARYDDKGNVIAYMPKTLNTLDNELKVAKDSFDKAAKLRGEVEKVSKVYRDVEDAYGRINASVEGESSGASDMALIFNYMKMLDPGSTVREGEFATASQTGGVPAHVRNLYNKAIDGQMLTPTQRGQFLSQAKKQFDTASKKQNKRLSDYEKLGKRYGLERGDIIVSEVEEDISKNEEDVIIEDHPKYGNITEADIQKTMSDTGMNREEVMARLQGG